MSVDDGKSVRAMRKEERAAENLVGGEQSFAAYNNLLPSYGST